MKIIWIALFAISVCFSVHSSSFNCETLDYNSSESFLNIFLTIYDMNWCSINSERIKEVLGKFESNPTVLFNDDICFPVVIEQINLGFIYDFSIFYDRSQRLTVRILMACPPNKVIADILEACEDSARIKVITIMSKLGCMPFLLDVLQRQKISSESYVNILINKLRS